MYYNYERKRKSCKNENIGTLERLHKSEQV